MITVGEALQQVLSAASDRGLMPDEEVCLREAAGRILRETVTADRDLPPFTRSAMDGYALRSADAVELPATLQVIEEIPAGSVPRHPVGPGQASKIMTGAALPVGADAIQMVEKTQRLPDGRVRILEPVVPGEHVRRAGEDLSRGSVLLEEGICLGAAHIGLLATAGRAAIRVSRRPRVAIIPTGDELVEADREPRPSQIRESNGHVLEALVTRAGGQADLLGIARDTLEDLREKIIPALDASDVLLLSGGVSMGDYDLVGGVLSDLGCRPLFDRVAIQPGKPLTFARGSRRGEVLVFGLPGNPVSTVVDFLVFARPALRRMMGSSSGPDEEISARLIQPLRRRAGRRAYLAASLKEEEGEMTVRLIPSMGSADMVALARANALAIIPEDAERLEAGVRVRVLPLAGLTTP